MMPCETIDLTCSQEEDSDIHSRKRKDDVVNVIDESPHPKKSRSEQLSQNATEGDKGNSNVSRAELKNLQRRIKALEEHVPAKCDQDNSDVTRQEFNELAARVTKIEERVCNIEQVLGNVKAAFLFQPPVPSTSNSKQTKAFVESSNEIESTPRRHSADSFQKEDRLPGSTSKGRLSDSTSQTTSKSRVEKEPTPQSSKAKPTLLKKVLTSASPSTSGSADKTPNRIPTVSNSSSTANQDMQQETASSTTSQQLKTSSSSSANTPSGMLILSGISSSSTSQVNQKRSTAVTTPSTSKQRTPDTTTSTPSVGPSPQCSNYQIRPSTSGPNDTPVRNPGQRSSTNLQKNVTNQTTSSPAIINRNPAPSTSRSSTSSASKPTQGNSQPPSSSHSASQKSQLDLKRASQNQKSLSDWELPAEALRNIRIKREVESDDTHAWQTVEMPQSIEVSGNFVVYIRGIGRKIRGQDKYVAVGGFSVEYCNRLGTSVSTNPQETVCVPFVSELNRKDYMGPKLWEKLKTEAIIMAAEKAIKSLKARQASSPLKLTIIASKNARKFITIMKTLQNPEIFPVLYHNFNNCKCETYPCTHRNRWDTCSPILSKFVCHYDLPKLCHVANGLDIVWLEQDDQDSQIYLNLKNEMTSKLSSQIKYSV